ncbi:MAG TPA: hypothetical protein VF152_09475 [Acidimicrobiia bacterium]
MSVRKGEPWGGPAAGPPDATVAGGDADLAAVVAARPGARIEFRPDAGSDLARALGVPGGRRPADAHELPLDALSLGDALGLSVNIAVLGTPPDRLRWWSREHDLEVVVDGRERFRGKATTVVVANGQYLRGADVVPRGHPGDGRVEVQVYRLRRGERRAMRRRLAQGAHVPHPRIREIPGRRIEVQTTGRGLPLEVDGVPGGLCRELAIEVVPNVCNVLV